MTDRERTLRAIEAQEALRGSVPDEIIDTAIAALRAGLADTEHRAQPGAGVSAGASMPPRRRQASVLFADVAGYTAMSEHLDPEIVAGLMNELWASIDATITGHGGRVDKHIGDAVMGVWGVDGAREDDPERAVRAALGLCSDFERFRDHHGLAIGVRVGVNTGPVVFGEVGTTGEVSVTGDAVNLASRVEHAAPDGVVLISHDTYRHVRGVFDVRPLEPVAVKGRSAPVRTYAVDRAKPRAFRLANRGVQGVETQMVGRDVELEQLTTACLEVLADDGARMITVVGEAGAGKSRLLDEFTSWIELRSESMHYLKGRSVPDQRTVVRGLLRELFAYRCQVFDDDSTDVVIAKLRSGLRGLSEREADVVGHWLGFDLTSSPAVADLSGSDEFGTVARGYLVRHLRAVLAEVPIVMLLEDLHWTDDESLDTIEYLASRLADEPLLIIGSARPSFVERRPLGLEGPRGPRPVRLEALTADEVAGLVRDILQHVPEVPASLVGLIVEQSDGNAFYVEELIKMLVDDGVIVPSDEGPWIVDEARLDTRAVPPTLSGVLQARLDALPDGERTALQHSAIVGRIFWDDAVAALLSETAAGRTSRERIASDLAGLGRKELIRPHERSIFSDADEFKFKHALLRDVTYETVLLEDRRRLHAAAATWLRARAGERVDEHLGTLAEHLVLAGELLRAAETFERAADLAGATGAAGPAIALYGRSVELRDQVGVTRSPAAVRARLRLVSLLRRSADVEGADRHLDIAAADAAASGDDESVAVSLIYLVGRHIDNGEWALAGECWRRAEPVARRVGGSTEAELFLARANLADGVDGPEAMLEYLGRGLAASRAGADPVLEVRVLAAFGSALRRLGRPDEAEQVFHEGLVLARRMGERGREAQMLHNLGTVFHVRARRPSDDVLERAVQLYRESMEILVDLGLDGQSNSTRGDLAQAEIEHGEIVAGAVRAHEFLRRGVDARMMQDITFGAIVHGELLLVVGQRSMGLRVIGAAASAPRAYSSRDEIERILVFHGVDDVGVADLGVLGEEEDLDAIVGALLEQGVGGRLATEPFVFG